MDKPNHERRDSMRIGLLWHSLSSDNLGVGALTESQLAIIRRAAERAGVAVSFCVFGTTGSRTELNSLSDVTVGDRLSVKRILVGQSAYVRQLRGCDLVLDIGEGDSFTDIYGTERFVYQSATKALVLALGKPLILSPQTIGPFGRRWTATVARWLMKRARRVYARDVLSSTYLAQLGVAGNAFEAIDVAFRLPYQTATLPPTTKTRVGLNISGLLYAGGYSGANQFGLTVDYRQLTERLIRYFTTREDCQLHLVGHVITNLVGNEDDYAVSRELAARFPGVILADKFGSPGAAKSYIAALDYFAGARMHACIAAFSAGVPVTPIAYSRKFSGLFSTLGYQQVADCKVLDTDAAFAMVIDGFENRNSLRGQIETGNRLALQKLQDYEDFLVSCLEGAHG